jgi:hypothetical protein
MRFVCKGRGTDETGELSIQSRIIRTIGLVLLPSLRDAATNMMRQFAAH